MIEILLQSVRRTAIILALAGLCPSISRAADEHITLSNGFELNCVHRELLVESGLVRLYTGANSATYLDVVPTSIRLIEPIDSASAIAAVPPPSSPTDIPTLLAAAAIHHHIDVDLLTSLVHAESAFHPQAVSHAGARGLMQLMPATAASLGVHDAFEPGQNIAGGTTYLDQLLTRFHDDITLALAAYNAGPAAVDRFHGVPPYRGTRAYVARILTEYNRRKRLTLTSPAH